MTHHTDGLDSIGARAGDTVRCTGMRDRGGLRRFEPGETYTVIAAPNGEPRIRSRMWSGSNDPCPSSFLFAGYGFFFEIAQRAEHPST